MDILIGGWKCDNNERLKHNTRPFIGEGLFEKHICFLAT